MPQTVPNKILKETTKGEMAEFSPNKEYSERILYDAKIKSPGNLKKK